MQGSGGGLAVAVAVAVAVVVAVAVGGGVPGVGGTQLPLKTNVSIPM